MTHIANPAEKIVTAGVLIIGNEILSGRTQDVNLNHIAKGLSDVGVTLCEARVIPDVANTIVATLNELRAKFDYVFTTGGIGPTHDDITLECVAQAFGVACKLHPQAHAILKEWYKDRPGQLNAARLRMATAPEGSTLIVNPVSRAPGFRMGNVFVMAGIPQIMQSMFDHVKPTLQGGRPIVSRSVRCNLPEGVSPKAWKTYRTAIWIATWVLSLAEGRQARHQPGCAGPRHPASRRRHTRGDRHGSEPWRQSKEE